MEKVIILESDMEKIKYERFNHLHPRVQLKMEVMYLHGLNCLSDELICKIADVCDNTRRCYLKQYRDGGIDRLKEVNFYRPSSDLQEYSGTIEEYFTNNPPSSISQAAAIIEKLTGIKRGETQVRKFLKSMKFRYLKSYSVPAKALTEEKKTNNENFWKKNLNPD
jgi:transposase